MKKNLNTNQVKEIKVFVFDQERDPKEIKESKELQKEFMYKRSKR